MTAEEKFLMDEEMKVNPPVEFAAETDECCEDDPHGEKVNGEWVLIIAPK